MRPSAEYLASQLADSHALARRVTGWLLGHPSLAHRELGDQRGANQAVERALGLAEADRLVLPFAMTGSADLLEALPRHETAHAALLAEILDVLHGSSPAAKEQSALSPRRSSARASSGCCGICRRTCPGPRLPANFPSR